MKRQSQRQATSPDEIHQIERVRALLVNVGVAPASELIVTLANGKEIAGWFASAAVGNKPERRGKEQSYFGALTLITEIGEVNIDYLDVVWLKKA